ncbi:HD domain-containing protein [Paenibacillus sp. SYP-B3998]|uniref:HD domain-containing protein n=1 Tax=Paenibacillus sp. SYP-B3998 TaxID=2678564 RepID=A0A6G3ZYM7_9BACL|nr:HD domain-containing protein [Paenibacillus sp. SYP-B3998]NEW06794.1 HD domain-containing protein [Paenibacillus sp. SYP-B3998]
MRPDIGNYDWCENHQAKLTPKEKFAMIKMLIQSQLKDTLGSVLFRMPLFPGKKIDVSLDEIRYPETHTVRMAEEYAKECCSEPLLYHCYRTYFWGALLGKSYGFKVDEELLFVSSILHDLGISSKHIHKTGQCCFATTGAREAYQLVTNMGWHPDRAKKVYESISLHLNPVINEQVYGPEARLVGEGATMDVLGAKSHRLSAAAIQAVHAKYARSGFTEDILHSITGVEHALDTRPKLLSSMGFGILARRNPLDRTEFNSPET